MTPPRLLFTVSSHGYGHATRSAALLAALVRAGVPRQNLLVRSGAPEWIFQRRVAELACARAALDPGLLQPNGLDLDLPGTLAAHEAFLAEWESLLEREADAIASFRADAVVADIAPLAFAAAASADVPAYGVANFSWDWILAEYAPDEPRWSRIVQRYRDAYASAHRLYRLPLHGDLGVFPHIRDVPLLVNRSDRTRAECRTALGLAPDETRPLILVSFGGFGGGEVRPSPDADLSTYLFMGTGEPPAKFPGEWIALPHRSADPHEDLVQAADAVLGKPGYSTIAEALTHRTRFLYVPREHFREARILERALATWGAARPIPRADFETTHWRPHLDALFTQPAPPSPPPHNGAEVIATQLLADLAQR